MILRWSVMESLLIYFLPSELQVQVSQSKQPRSEGTRAHQKPLKVSFHSMSYTFFTSSICQKDQSRPEKGFPSASLMAFPCVIRSLVVNLQNLCCCYVQRKSCEGLIEWFNPPSRSAASDTNKRLSISTWPNTRIDVVKSFIVPFSKLRECNQMYVKISNISILPKIPKYLTRS